MMQVYLPVAGVYVNAISVIVVGVISGTLAGTFGVGGTFFAIPVLTSLGIPPASAIASCTLQMVASSISLAGFYWRNGMVDLKLCIIALLGTIVGSLLGGKLFAYLESISQLSSAIALIYVFLLGTIASYTAQDSVRALMAKYRNTEPVTNDALYNFFVKWPMHITFSKLNLQISGILVIFTGLLSSMVVALAGIGGGFLVIPMFIYAMRVPTSTALGTSNVIGFGAVFLSAIIQCISSKSVDVVLSAILVFSSIAGVGFGSKIYKKIPPEELRMILSIITFILIIKFLIQILAPTSELYDFVTLLGEEVLQG